MPRTKTLFGQKDAVDLYRELVARFSEPKLCQEAIRRGALGLDDSAQAMEHLRSLQKYIVVSGDSSRFSMEGARHFEDWVARWMHQGVWDRLLAARRQRRARSTGGVESKGSIAIAANAATVFATVAERAGMDRQAFFDAFTLWLSSNDDGRRAEQSFMRYVNEKRQYEALQMLSANLGTQVSDAHRLLLLVHGHDRELVRQWLLRLYAAQQKRSAATVRALVQQIARTRQFRQFKADLFTFAGPHDC